MKKTLASLVTALWLGQSSCATNQSAQARFNQVFDDIPLMGLGVRYEKENFVVGLDVNYGAYDTTNIEDNINVMDMMNIPVEGREDIYKVQIAPSLEYKAFEWGPCDYFKMYALAGSGYNIDLNVGVTDFTIGGNNIGSLPSSIEFIGNFFFVARTGIKVYKIPFDYSLKVKLDGTLTHTLSIGYEF